MLAVFIIRTARRCVVAAPFMAVVSIDVITVIRRGDLLMSQ